MVSSISLYSNVTLSYYETGLYVYDELNVTPV